jgi:plastocyanin
MSAKIQRRKFLILAGSGITGIGAASQRLSPDVTQGSDSDTPRILALSSYIRGVYYFDPAGLYVEVGQTVQWAGMGSRTTTAFHPSINNKELRIPEGAEPFDSRTMAPGEGIFSWTFDVEGTYDYYSRPHEYLGMVGRIVVGKPGGPGEEPPGYGNYCSEKGRSLSPGTRGTSLPLAIGDKSTEAVAHARKQAFLLEPTSFSWRFRGTGLYFPGVPGLGTGEKAARTRSR